MNNIVLRDYPRILLTSEQIRKRVQDIARQISEDYRGKTIHVVGVLEPGFIFMADLVRHISVPVVCQFLKTQSSQTESGTEIFFSFEPEVRGRDVLLVEALVQSGVTSGYLMESLRVRGANSVKLVVLLDKQAARRIALQPDYFGFLMQAEFVVGYGLGAPDIGRNLPYIAAKA
jgi:hypoxanthine phosphoribosyltransferase